MRRFWGMGLVIVVAVATGCGLFSFRSAEPVYAGKSLTEWLDAGSEPAAMAVHEIGPAATPWILRKIRWEHPRWGRWQTYQYYWRLVPAFVHQVMPKPRIAAYDEFKAMAVLLEVGPGVIPQLNAALKEKNPGVRITCAMTLDSLHDRGLKDAKSIAALRAALQDEHPEVRKTIARVTAKVESPPQP